MNVKDIFYTQSTNLAAYLVMNGFEIIGKQKSINMTTIYFTKSDELHNCVRRYNEETELKKFIAAFKSVKTILNN